MSATNFSLAKYGAANDESALGLFVGDLTRSLKVDKVDIKNHVGTVVGFTLADDSQDIKASGVIVTKTVGIVPGLASVVVLADTTAHSLTLNSKGMITTAVVNAGIVVIGAELKRANSEHETGDISMVFHPGVTTNAPVTVT